VKVSPFLAVRDLWGKNKGIAPARRGKVTRLGQAQNPKAARK